MAVHKTLRNTLLAAVAAAALSVGVSALRPAAAEGTMRIDAPAADLPSSSGPQSLVLAGGCFWGLQGMFEHVKGVTRVTAGYAGGSADTAHYEMVGSGETGHAESVKIDYDPAEISYGRLLQLFFSAAHDPTQVGGQGPDEGSQYRSAIFVANPQERQVAEHYVAQLGGSGAFHGRIATSIEPLKGFYAAEGYHQDYLIQHPGSMYIVVNDLPKIAALHKLYPELYRAEPVRSTSGS